MDYKSELDFVCSADDSLFPDFLFNSLFNDFNDNYYQRSFADDELIASVKKLRRRYVNFFDWVDAMEIYNEYMDSLVDKYGSMRVVKNSIKADMIDDPVPAKPRLKNSKKNRQFIRAGVTPARMAEKDPITKEELLVIARQAIPNAMGEDAPDYEELKLSKKNRKFVEDVRDKIAGRDRKRNLYRSVGNNHGTDFIVEYLNQSKQGFYDSSGYNKNEKTSIWEMYKEDEKIKYERPEILDLEESNPTVIVNGRIVSKSENMRMELYKELHMQGFDIIGTLGKSMNKKSVKMIRSQIGATEPATKKEMKKIRKRAKKDRERIERRRDSDSLLEKTLLGNKFSFDTNENNISFRLKDLYRD